MRYQDGLHKDIGRVETAGPDIFVMPMWTEDYCAHVIEQAEKNQDFRFGSGYAGAGESDKIKTRDAKLSALPEVFEGYLQTYETLLRKIIKKVWLVQLEHSDAFITRYSLDTQTRLLPHIDQSSIVSMTIRLNDDYQGGALRFVRQNLLNSQVPIGYICFFPSGVTHIHEVLPLTQGTRYAITFWTKPPAPSPAPSPMSSPAAEPVR